MLQPMLNDLILEKLQSDVNLDLEYITTLQMARAMASAMEYASAVPLLIDLLDTPRGNLSTTDIMYELAECSLHTGEYD